MAERFHVLLARAVERGVGEFIEQDVRLAVEHAIALLNGSVADGLRQVTLAGAGRAEKQRVFMLVDEAAGGQVEDEAAIHLLVEVEVEVVERLVRIAEARLFLPPLQQTVAATREFVGDQTRRSSRWAPSVRPGPGAGGFRARRPCRRDAVVAVHVGVQSDSWLVLLGWFVLMRSRYWVSSRMSGSTWRSVSGAGGLRSR